MLSGATGAISVSEIRFLPKSISRTRPRLLVESPETAEYLPESISSMGSGDFVDPWNNAWAMESLDLQPLSCACSAVAYALQSVIFLREFLPHVTRNRSEITCELHALSYGVSFNSTSWRANSLEKCTFLNWNHVYIKSSYQVTMGNRESMYLYCIIKYCNQVT